MARVQAADQPCRAQAAGFQAHGGRPGASSAGSSRSASSSSAAVLSAGQALAIAASSGCAPGPAGVLPE
eukprot:11208992-Lingulodinium_polyedra.AAC.1